jgi:hypothetical protein
MTRLILEITVQGTSPPQPAEQRQSADPTLGRRAEAMAHRAGNSSGAGTARDARVRRREGGVGARLSPLQVRGGSVAGGE